MSHNDMATKAENVNANELRRKITYSFNKFYLSLKNNINIKANKRDNNETIKNLFIR